jgi:hypothetical protein
MLDCMKCHMRLLLAVQQMLTVINNTYTNFLISKAVDFEEA